jgi:hypothetical protein
MSTITDEQLAAHVAPESDGKPYATHSLVEALRGERATNARLRSIHACKSPECDGTCAPESIVRLVATNEELRAELVVATAEGTRAERANRGNFTRAYELGERARAAEATNEELRAALAQQQERADRLAADALTVDGEAMELSARVQRLEAEGAVMCEALGYAGSALAGAAKLAELPPVVATTAAVAAMFRADAEKCATALAGDVGRSFLEERDALLDELQRCYDALGANDGSPCHDVRQAKPLSGFVASSVHATVAKLRATEEERDTWKRRTELREGELRELRASVAMVTVAALAERVRLLEGLLGDARICIIARSEGCRWLQEDGLMQRIVAAIDRAALCVCGHARSEHRQCADHDECMACEGDKPCSEWRLAALDRAGLPSTPPATAGEPPEFCEGCEKYTGGHCGCGLHLLRPDGEARDDAQAGLPGEGRVQSCSVEVGGSSPGPCEVRAYAEPPVKCATCRDAATVIGWDAAPDGGWTKVPCPDCGNAGLHGEGREPAPACGECRKAPNAGPCPGPRFRVLDTADAHAEGLHVGVHAYASGDCRACHGDGRDYATELWDYGATPPAFVGSDRCEPEDATLFRGFEWVADALNAVDDKVRAEARREALAEAIPLACTHCRQGRPLRANGWQHEWDGTEGRDVGRTLRQPCRADAIRHRLAEVASPAPLGVPPTCLLCSKPPVRGGQCEEHAAEHEPDAPTRETKGGTDA